jgi:serine/threonine protein phosphatase PrpC
MWKVIGASVTGNSHRALDAGCQDASGWCSGPEVTCLAIADGAGSRPLSAAGSELAVERALTTAMKCATEPAGPASPAVWIRAAFEDAHQHIVGMAMDAEKTADDYATTLAVGILTPHIVAIGQVGDSIVVTGHAAHYCAVAPETKGEYVNETFFVTMRDAFDHLRVTVLPAREVDFVVLSTDGLRYKILSDLVAGAPFKPFFDDLAHYVRTPEAAPDGIAQFLADLDDQTGDDKTLVAAVRTSSRRACPEPQERCGAMPCT